MILRKHKKIDLVLLVFGTIAFFVIISVSVILYLLFNKYYQKNSNVNVDTNQTSYQNQENTLPQVSPEQLKSNYKAEIKKQIFFVENSNLDIIELAGQLENNLLQIRVPAEDREKFLDVTLQVVRIQKQALDTDVSVSKQKILQMLNDLVY